MLPEVELQPGTEPGTEPGTDPVLMCPHVSTNESKQGTCRPAAGFIQRTAAEGEHVISVFALRNQRRSAN